MPTVDQAWVRRQRDDYGRSAGRQIAGFVDTPSSPTGGQGPLVNMPRERKFARIADANGVIAGGGRIREAVVAAAPRVATRVVPPI